MDVCIANGGEEEPLAWTRSWRGGPIRFDVDGMVGRYPRLSPMDRYKELSGNEGAMGWMEYDIAKLTFQEWKRNFFEQLSGPYPVGYGLITPLHCSTPDNRVVNEVGKAGLAPGSYSFKGENGLWIAPPNAELSNCKLKIRVVPKISCRRKLELPS